MVISFSGGRSRSTQREPSTMGKQLVNLLIQAFNCLGEEPHCVKGIQRVNPEASEF
jgi:hypothetical protein